ncbi:hypothetical protein OSB04_010454 [Centaurea solstitialis]|uniref:NIN-like protein n=1 Tax=Centaurea solstitialis TaxID=347529 RepID=A0AA38T7L1_9ASTR|nr:hypothetical protein OSB04_010454 [Centaurea solstitialis]
MKQTICGLQHAKNEIDEALKIIWGRQRFISAQVWIACEDENRVAFTSLEDTPTKRVIGLKLTGHCFIPHGEDFKWEQKRLEAYGNACYSLPLKMDEGLAGKTLQNYEPHFIHNIQMFSANAPQRLLSSGFEHTCLVIYLRSTKTGDIDYVFEFLWSREREHTAFLFESLLLELMERLPSFKFASGAKVGDELHILNVKNSTKSELEYFKIFITKNLSSASVARKRLRRQEVEECLRPLNAKCKTTPITLSQDDIQPHFGKTMIEAAKHLNVSLSTLKRKCKALGIYEWPRKDYLKRNVKHLYKSQSNTNEEEDYGGAVQDPTANNRETYLDENIVTIKAMYADDMIKFHLPISSTTFGAIEKEIREAFKLNPSDYKVKYLDEDGDWILLSSENDMRVCIQNHRNLNMTPISMQVLQRKI